MIRAFLAVELPDALREEVAVFETELKRSGADIKWVDPANLHLTLKFLGSIADEQSSALAESLKKSCGPLPSFTLMLDGIGAFPKTTSPRVLWVGVGEGKEALTELARTIEETCAGFGFPAEERPFSAHLTIGRTRSTQGIARLVKQLQLAEFRGKTPAKVTRVILFQSTLGPKGPTYSTLAEIQLSG